MALPSPVNGAPRSAGAPAQTRPRFASIAGQARQQRDHRALWTAALTMLAGMVLILPAGAALQVVLTAQLDDRTPTQAIVMLDPARVWGDPEAARQARMVHASELYAQGVAPVVVITGPRKNSEPARDALIASGIPESDVVVFPTGSDTVGSLGVVATVIRDLGWSSATIVTDPAHAARAQVTAGKYGIDSHVSPTDAGGSSSLTSEYVGREVLALMRHYLFTQWSLPNIVPSA